MFDADLIRRIRDCFSLAELTLADAEQAVVARRRLAAGEAVAADSQSVATARGIIADAFGSAIRSGDRVREVLAFPGWPSEGQSLRNAFSGLSASLLASADANGDAGLSWALRDETNDLIGAVGRLSASIALVHRVFNELSANSQQRVESIVPSWNALRGTLTFEGQVVRRVRVRGEATDIQRLLDAFHEEQWVPIVDDPLPPNGCRDACQRLHQAVRRLNSGLKAIRFSVHRSGQAIGWNAIEAREALE